MSEKVQSMFKNIAQRYDLANNFMSFGTHWIWKKRAIVLLEITKDEKILDLCCGTGDLSELIHKNYAAQVFGVDFVEGMLKVAKKRNREINFIGGDALTLPFLNSTFDKAIISFGIRNVDSTEQCLVEIKRVLKPNGKIVVLEFGKPYLPVWSQVFQIYSKHIMPIIGGIISGDKSAYTYLPESSAKYLCGAKFKDLMDQVGFRDTSWNGVFGGVAYFYSGRK